MFPLYVIFVSGTLGSAHYGSDLFWTIAFGLSRKNFVHGISRVLLEISSIFSSFLALKCNRCMEVVGTQTGRQTDEMFRKAGRERVLSHSRGLHTAPHTLHWSASHSKILFFHSKGFGAKKASGFFQIKCGPQPTPRVILNILTLTTTSIPWRHNALQCGWWGGVLHIV